MDGQQPSSGGKQGQQKRKRSNRNYSNKQSGGRQFQRRMPADQPPALGFFSGPSLADLQRENRKRTRRHYNPRQSNGRRRHQQQPALGGARVPLSFIPVRAWYPPTGQQRHYSNRARPNPTPSAMPPPPSPGTFLGAGVQYPTDTPQLPASGALAAPQDKLEAEGLHADLDFYGTNEGLVYYNEEEEEGAEQHSSDGDAGDRSHSVSHSRSESESEGEGGGSGARRSGKQGGGGGGGGGRGGGGGGEGDDLHKRIVRRLRERVAQQDVYIATLEDETLNLRERLDLARQELQELRPRAGKGAAASSARAAGGEHSRAPAAEAEPAEALS
jgi:hypothetical protein